MTGVAGAQSSALALLERVLPEAARFDADAAYFENRTTEFVLLLARLGRIEGVRLDRLLEVGCGRGWTARLWAEVAGDVTGIDVAPAVARARQLLETFRPPRANVRLLESSAETLAGVEGRFSLVVTQYVLEHVTDIAATLRALRARLTPDGFAVHVLNNAVDRHDAFVERRLPPAGSRWWRSLRERGLRRGFGGLLAWVPPHEPSFGDFATELREYRLERWALRLLREGFEIVDWFQTRDINWVLVTRAAGA